MTQLDSDDVENIKARCPQFQQTAGDLNIKLGIFLDGEQVSDNP